MSSNIKLGDGKRWTQYEKPSADILNTFPTPRPGVEFVVTFDTKELTALCPLTGHPDYYHLTIDYIPKDKCIESKSAKMYFGSYRNHGAFIETLANQILDDWVKVCDPNYMRVELTMNIRGGVGMSVIREYKGEEDED